MDNVSLWPWSRCRNCARSEVSMDVRRGRNPPRRGVHDPGVGGETGTVDVLDLERNVKVCTVEVGLQAGGTAFWKTE